MASAVGPMMLFNARCTLRVFILWTNKGLTTTKQLLHMETCGLKSTQKCMKLILSIFQSEYLLLMSGGMAAGIIYTDTIASQASQNTHIHLLHWHFIHVCI